MLGFTGDDMFALAAIKMRRALNRQVVGFGRAGSPYNFFGIGVNEPRYLHARFLHRFLRFPTKGMRAGSGITEFSVRREVTTHFFRYARIHRRSSGIIKVNGFFHPISKILSYGTMDALLPRGRISPDVTQPLAQSAA